MGQVLSLREWPGMPLSISQSASLRKGIVTLKSPWRSSSTGVSFHCPFFARPIGVRFAKVMTTSSGFLARMADNPREGLVEAARMAKGRMNVDLKTSDMVGCRLPRACQELYNQIRVNDSPSRIHRFQMRNKSLMGRVLLSMKGALRAYIMYAINDQTVDVLAILFSSPSSQL